MGGQVVEQSFPSSKGHPSWPNATMMELRIRITHFIIQNSTQSPRSISSFDFCIAYRCFPRWGKFSLIIGFNTGIRDRCAFPASQQNLKPPIDQFIRAPHPQEQDKYHDWCISGEASSGSFSIYLRYLSLQYSHQMNTKSHWENVFTKKRDNEKSWYEDYPTTSMNLIRELGLTKYSSIIDVGGGDSHLVDALVKNKFTDITVLDISEIALNNAKERLGDDAGSVNWIVSDVLKFEASRQYDCWHDRAVFHFITSENEIHAYIQKMISTIKTGGHLILATFSEKGPKQCSGLPVKRYSQAEMTSFLSPYFHKIKCIEENHLTPFRTIQPFTYCGFSRKHFNE